MNTRPPFTIGRVLALTALLTASAFSPASAEGPGGPGPVAQCLEECRASRGDCVGGCNAAFADCMRGPRLEARICRRDCVAQFEEDSIELEGCVETCRTEIVVPARQECGPARRECVPECGPALCPRLCRPGGGGLDEVDECRVACAVDLRSCSKAGKAALQECLAPCRELTEEAERETCVGGCIEAAGAGAAACVEGFQSCSAGCEPTTTTLP